MSSFSTVESSVGNLRSKGALVQALRKLNIAHYTTLAKNAFDNAIADLETLEEEEYRD
jgi:hypothetical protein